MTTGFKMFLLAAEEMNFSRAADRAFVTPQCFSDHIKRLEEIYNVTLFQRKPSIRLTPEGKAMLKYLRRIQALEAGMEKELSDINSGTKGSLNFGIAATRGATIIPNLIPKFQSTYPQINIHIQLNDTKMLEQQLLNNQLDIFVGVNTNHHTLFQRKKLCKDSLYLILSKRLIKYYFPNNYQDLIAEFKNGADLNKLTHIPFIKMHDFSTTNYLFSQFLLKKQIELNIPLEVSNSDIILQLCAKGFYATTISFFHLERLIAINETLSEEEKLLIFPIKNFTDSLTIEIITHRDIQPLNYLNAFSSMLEEFILQTNADIQSYLWNQMF